jgi:regulator of protease activity HflC (stomatin/prohibitin superfamily)
MPMSASCVVNRKELLASLAEVQRLLPKEFAEAVAVVEHRQAAIDSGRAEAARLVEEARRERQALVYNTDIYREARRSADELMAQAQAEAEGLRREVDDYVDHKLAGLEIALNKTLASVAEGRDRLRGRAPTNRRGEVPLAPREADEYVDHKLSRFEHSLHKTLDAVTRGRERLRDRSGLDTYTAEEDAPPLPT